MMTILPVLDLERAREFYQDKLGLRPRGALGSETTLVLEGGDGTRIEIEERDQPSKAEHTVLTFEVDDVEREVAELEQRGVHFEDYDLPALKTEHHVAVMDGVKAAWFKDPDGNILCIHQKAA